MKNISNNIGLNKVTLNYNTTDENLVDSSEETLRVVLIAPRDGTFLASKERLIV